MSNAPNADTGSIKAVAGSLWNVIRVQLIDEAPKIIGEAVEAYGGDTAGRVAKQVIQKTIAYGDTGLKFFGALQGGRKAKNETLEVVAPYLKHDGKKASALSIYKSNNSVIQIEGMRIFGRGKYDVLTTSMSLANSLVVDQTSSGGARVEYDLEKPIENGDKRQEVKDRSTKLAKSVASAGVPLFEEYMQKRGEDTYGKPTPLDLIRLIEGAGQNSQVQVPPELGFQLGLKSNYIDTANAIMLAFQTSREWTNGAPITHEARFYEELHTACQTLAAEIQSGGLDAYALIDLIGNDKVIGKDNKVISAQQLSHAMRQSQEIALSANPNFVQEYMTSTEYTLEELKQTMDGLSAEYQPLFASFLPNIVLEKTGFKKDQIDAWEKVNRDDYLEALVSVLENVAAQSEEVLQESGLKPREARELKLGAMALLQRNDQEINEYLSSKEGKKLEKILLNDKQLWTDRIKNTAKPEKEVLDLSDSVPRDADAPHGIKPRGNHVEAATNRETVQHQL